MKRLLGYAAVLVMAFANWSVKGQVAAPAAPAVHAAGDIAGDWQGTINPGKETQM